MDIWRGYQTAESLNLPGIINHTGGWLDNSEPLQHG
jgi:hypothetical protein